MTTDTSDVKVSTFGSDTVINLPPRPASGMRFVGCLPIFFPLIGSTLVAVFINLAVLQPANVPLQVEAPAHPPQPAVFQYVIAAIIAIPVLLFDLMLVYAGIRMLLPNTAVIRLTDTELLLIVKAGPFPKTRKRPLAEITQLRISDTFPGLQFPPKIGEPKRSSFLIDCKTQSMLVALPGYYKATVIAAANALADELKRRNLPVAPPVTDAPVDLDPPADPVPPAVLSVDDSNSPVPQTPDPVATAPQPANSKITFLQEPDSLTFMIPRTGIRGAALGLLLFSLIWNGIVGIIFITFMAVFIHQPSGMNFFPLIFISLFLTVGLLVFLLFLQTAYRRTVIVATPATLIITQNAPIRNTEYQWPREDMKAVKTEYSGTRVNDRQYRELRILFTNDAHKGYFDGRDNDELEWLAATLRSFYGLV